MCVKIENFDDAAHIVIKHVICDLEPCISFTLQVIMYLVVLLVSNVAEETENCRM